jgi:hypothetical protein
VLALRCAGARGVAASAALVPSGVRHRRARARRMRDAAGVACDWRCWPTWRPGGATPRRSVVRIHPPPPRRPDAPDCSAWLRSGVLALRCAGARDAAGIGRIMRMIAREWRCWPAWRSGGIVWCLRTRAYHERDARANTHRSHTVAACDAGTRGGPTLSDRT